MKLPNIILGEDDEAYQAVLEEMLEGIQANFLKAKTGYEILTLLEERAGCALVITDLYMADLDGLALVSELRQRAAYKHLPVILITSAFGNERAVLNDAELGAADYLLKPVQAGVLRRKVACFLDLHAEREAAVREINRLVEAIGRLQLEKGRLAETLERLRHYQDSVPGRRDYLARIIHELRSPLKAILSFCELLVDAEASPADKESYIARIRCNAGLLGRVVDDLVGLTQSEQGELELVRKPMHWPNVLASVLCDFHSRVAEKSLKLIERLDGADAPWIYSDPMRFRQIMLNLLENALKFTSVGSIEVSSRVVPARGERKGALEIRVRDSGCGISANEREAVFEPFRRGEVSRNHSVQGLGLGLAIARCFAERLGGRLKLEESTPGRGSTFCFEHELALSPDVRAWERTLSCATRQCPTKAAEESVPWQRPLKYLRSLWEKRCGR